MMSTIYIPYTVDIRGYLCYLCNVRVTMKKQLRSVIRTLWIFILIISISGCRTPSPPESGQKILRIGTVHRAASTNILFDNALALFSVISHPPLLRLNRNGRISGLLAENFGFSDDYTTWTFSIKKNRFWSDGKPVSSADVRFTLRYKSKHIPSRRWLRMAIKKIETPGPHKIRITFNRPYTRFDIEMTSIRIFPRHIWKNVSDPQDIGTRKSYIGCGPFVIRDVELFSGTVHFARNRYWKGRPPWLNGYEVHMYHNPDVLSLALERGDVDCAYKYADTFPYVYVPSLKAGGKFKILEYRQSGFIFLGFNLIRGPLVDRNLRTAILYALNYREMVRLTVSKYGTIPSKGFIPPYFLYAQSSEPLHQDTRQSTYLLDKQGYRDMNHDGIREDLRGKALSLNLVTTPLYIRLAELIKDYLEQIGIRCRIQIVDEAAWINAKDNYHYDLTITRTTPWGMMMHAGWASGYFDFRRSGEGVLHTIKDPVYIRLCDRILATKNTSRISGYAREIQRYYAEHIPAVALIYKNDVIPVKKNITGWNYDPLFGIYNQDSFLNMGFTHGQH
jgi:peptide/nickel transport system substrate-binding protein